MTKVREQIVTGRYAGKCVGGPRDGEMLIHWASEHLTYKPVCDYFDVIFDRRPPVMELMLVGTYVHSGDLWLWRQP
jgi:hypothetical protein